MFHFQNCAPAILEEKSVLILLFLIEPACELGQHATQPGTAKEWSQTTIIKRQSPQNPWNKESNRDMKQISLLYGI